MSNKGIPVLGLFPGCHAERAGVQVGDRIVQVNGYAIDNITDYVEAIKNRGHSQTVVVLRDGILIDLEMVIGPPTAEGSSN